MIKQLRIQNFKSWKDTGDMRLAPITGIFGCNSSGKTAILHFLLMLKQTVETLDQRRVLHTGNEHTYVNLGTFYDIVHQHQIPGELSFSVDWKPDLSKIKIPEAQGLIGDNLRFDATIYGDLDNISVREFLYELSVDNKPYKLEMKENYSKHYEIVFHDISKKYRGLFLKEGSFLPIKCYFFPDFYIPEESIPKAILHIIRLISPLLFEDIFKSISYLGPLGEYPHRFYFWSGEHPKDVGVRGENAISVLLASQRAKQNESGQETLTVVEQVARWLKELGLVHSFALQPIAPNRREYEVLVQSSPGSPKVPLPDVGFGVSQVLPVITLCYSAPPGSILLFEQPEIHLHPSVQAGLADVFIDAIKTRNIQIILESHSEHLLLRLQRRIAEEQLTSDKAALYFCAMNEAGESELTALNLDPFGNISNWPVDFFGNEMGDLAAQLRAEMKRRASGEQ